MENGLECLEYADEAKSKVRCHADGLEYLNVWKREWKSWEMKKILGLKMAEMKFNEWKMESKSVIEFHQHLLLSLCLT